MTFLSFLSPREAWTQSRVRLEGAGCHQTLPRLLQMEGSWEPRSSPHQWDCWYTEKPMGRVGAGRTAIEQGG